MPESKLKAIKSDERRKKFFLYFFWAPLFRVKRFEISNDSRSNRIDKSYRRHFFSLEKKPFRFGVVTDCDSAVCAKISISRTTLGKYKYNLSHLCFYSPELKIQKKKKNEKKKTRSTAIKKTVNGDEEFLVRIRTMVFRFLFITLLPFLLYFCLIVTFYIFLDFSEIELYSLDAELKRAFFHHFQVCSPGVRQQPGELARYTCPPPMRDRERKRKQELCSIFIFPQLELFEHSILINSILNLCLFFLNLKFVYACRASSCRFVWPDSAFSFSPRSSSCLTDALNILVWIGTNLRNWLIYLFLKCGSVIVDNKNKNLPFPYLETYRENLTSFNFWEPHAGPGAHYCSVTKNFCLLPVQ